MAVHLRSPLAPWAEVVPGVAPIAVDTLLTLPDDGYVYEVVDGVLVHLVWVPWPQAQHADIWRPATLDRPAATLNVGDALDGEDVILGFTYPVADVFADPLAQRIGVRDMREVDNGNWRVGLAIGRACVRG